MAAGGITHTAALCFAFFVSGAAALSFEALWFHQTSLAFGSAVRASALVLTGFMAGMALGNRLAARFGDRVARPLRIYAGLELLIAAAGIALVHLLPALASVLAPLSTALEGSPALLDAARLLAAFLLLLLPSTAMGMTLPLAVRSLHAWSPSFGRSLGLLYGFNTLGAMAGVLLTEFQLLGSLGVRTSALAAGALSILAALLAWAIAAGAPAPDAAGVEPAPAPSARPTEAPAGAAKWLWATALAGFSMLALEVVWLRLLLLFLVDTPEAFAIVLALVLGGIALGGLAASVWLGRAPEGTAISDRAALTAFAAGILGLIGYQLFPSFLQRFFMFDQTAVSIAGIAAPVVLPTALASGALFTVLGVGLRQVATASHGSGDGDADVTGRLTFANTTGSALGSALAGLWLLRAIGMEHALFALLALYGLVGVLLWRGSGPMTPLRYGALALFLGTLTTFPFGKVDKTYVAGSVGRWMSPEDEIVSVREGLTSTLIHVRHRFAGLPLYDQLASNSFSMAVNDFAARRYMKLYAYLPLALHPGMKQALVIGYGIGNTAKALSDTPELERIDVVDISPETIELAREMHVGDGQHPLDDPRVHVHIEDGRHYLYGTERRYDLITGEPPPPILAGVSNLYSREYFKLMRERLAEGGFVSYWLPMMNISADTGRSIISAFCAAFEDCSLWHGSGRNFMLLGSRNARGPVSMPRFIRQWTSPRVRPELIAVGFEHPAQLGALFIGDAAYLRTTTRDVEPLTDDQPKRMHQPGSREERDGLMWEWRDTSAAAQRFKASPLAKQLWPERILEDSTRNFENQRLLNDLLFPGKSAARQAAVLGQVMATPLNFPVLLLAGSDPDIQRALAHANGQQQLATPTLLPHLAAAQLVARNPSAALALLRRTPAERQPLPGLVEFLEAQLYGAKPSSSANAAVPAPAAAATAEPAEPAHAAEGPTVEAPSAKPATDSVATPATPAM